MVGCQAEERAREGSNKGKVSYLQAHVLADVEGQQLGQPHQQVRRRVPGRAAGGPDAGDHHHETGRGQADRAWVGEHVGGRCWVASVVSGGWRCVGG